MKRSKCLVLFTLLVLSKNFYIFSGKTENRHIDHSSYGTYVTPLITAALNTEGPILEMGIGDFSTPVLHEICAIKKRLLLSVDSKEEKISTFADLKNEWHQFKFVKSIDDWSNIGNDTRWSVVLIDHMPGEQRIIDIGRLRKNTDIFVIHDTEECWNHLYDYQPYISTFKYKYVYKRYIVQTTLISDTIDVAKFFAN